MYKRIKDDLYYIGVLDKSLKVFDVIMETKYGTSYNSYLIKTTKNNILVESVKNKFFDEYLKNLKSLGVDDINYIIVNHTEPDHAGSIEKLLDIYPNMEVIGSKAAINYLKDITNRQFNNKIVKPDEEITIDNKTFKFISAPFLHWPDSIYTYLVEDKVLFTCDSFGAHYAHENIFLSTITNEFDYLEAFRYYYDAIFSPFKKYVLQAIDKIKDMEINYICCGHGPVLDRNINFYLDTYKKWSTVENPYGKLVVIPYATSYGYTEMMANLIASGIKDIDNEIDVRLYNLNVLNYKQLEEKIVEEIYYAKAVLFGSTTINKDATPVIWDLAINLNAIIHQGKYVTTFGSYGWSGEGVDNIHLRLKSASLKVLPSLKLKFKPSINDEEILINYGRDVANYILNNENHINIINNEKITMKD